jgi:hypothetical protein
LQEEAAQKLPPAGLGRILKLNAPELPYIIVGCITAFLGGAIAPVFAIILSEILAVSANQSFVFNFSI